MSYKLVITAVLLFCASSFALIADQAPQQQNRQNQKSQKQQKYNKNNYNRQKNPKGKVDSNWEHHADKNHDGYVNNKEANKHNNKYQKGMVDSKWEHHADRNHDGYVNNKEAKIYKNRKDGQTNNFRSDEGNQRFQNRPPDQGMNENGNRYEDQENESYSGNNERSDENQNNFGKGVRIPDLNKDGYVDQKEMQMHKQNMRKNKYTNNNSGNNRPDKYNN